MQPSAFYLPWVIHPMYPGASTSSRLAKDYNSIRVQESLNRQLNEGIKPGHLGQRLVERPRIHTKVALKEQLATLATLLDKIL